MFLPHMYMHIYIMYSIYEIQTWIMCVMIICLKTRLFYNAAHWQLDYTQSDTFEVDWHTVPSIKIPRAQV